MPELGIAERTLPPREPAKGLDRPYNSNGVGEVTETDGQELYLKQHDEIGFNDVLQTIFNFNSGDVPSFNTVLDAISRFNKRN